MQICNGVETDKTEYQYVNLGDLSDACITRPVTCGGEGATVSLWLKVEHCGTNDGALSTSDYYYDGGPTPREGFIVSCFTTGMRYTLYNPCSPPLQSLSYLFSCHIINFSLKLKGSDERCLHKIYCNYTYVIFNFHSLQIHFYLSKRWLSCYNRSSHWMVPHCADSTRK